MRLNDDTSLDTSLYDTSLYDASIISTDNVEDLIVL